MKIIFKLLFVFTLIVLLTGCNQVVQPNYEYKTIALNCWLVTFDVKAVTCYDASKADEYQDVPIIDFPTYESFFNDFAKDGWRVINIENIPSKYDQSRLVTFERIKK